MAAFFRILVILVVAVLIGGLMYAGVGASDSSAGLGGFEDEEGRSQRPEGGDFRPEHDEGREGGGFGFPSGVIKALVLMSIAGGVYSAMAWAGKKSARKTSMP